MNQRTASLAALIVAAMAVVAVPAAGLGPGAIPGGQDPGAAANEEANATNAGAAANGTANGTPPGSQLTGIVGVQKAEIEGEVESRSFEIALNRSGDNASKKAAVVANQVTDIASRLEALERRKAELDRARENGTITEGEYRARIAEVGARIATLRRLTNQTANASRGIPAEELEARGVNASKINELRNNARNLSGPEVAEIAKQIAGPGAGKGLGRGPPENRTGPPGAGDPGPPGDDNGPPGGDGGPPGNDNGPPGSDDDNESDTSGNGPPGASDPANDDTDVPGTNGSENGASDAETGTLPGSDAGNETPPGTDTASGGDGTENASAPANGSDDATDSGNVTVPGGDDPPENGTAPDDGSDGTASGDAGTDGSAASLGDAPYGASDSLLAPTRG